ncbi:P2Y purinoceptor 4-like [Danio aesculapii]|uniref:P2Y purinoceptor 4-like n=1 Tax=Danio aesculapii TaxID=1142201 RepID=UPI0024C0C587|nr:P2Y purinoceptor 4-like [Danio aesculapii]
MANSTSNGTQATTIYSNISETTNIQLPLQSIADKCNQEVFSHVRLPLEISTIVMGLPTNVALLWLLMNGEKALSPFDVLGLNLAVLNIMYCLGLPLDVYITLTESPGELLPASEALYILNTIGCPLLLTCMCVERYIATAHAVLYMKYGSKREYRAVCSALVWIITLGLAVITYLERLPELALYLSIILEIFLLVMVACLIGIVRALRKKGPGEGQRSGSCVKKRALKNTLTMLVLTAVIYGPVLGLFPYILTVSNSQIEPTYTFCLILNVIHTIPSLGVCIGPVFYVSRAKELACWRKKDEHKQTTTTQETQEHK